MSRQRLRAALLAMDEASSLEAWSAAAEDHDTLTGALAWRADDTSPAYDADRLRADLRTLAELRARSDVEGVARHLGESLTRHHSGLTLPQLHEVAFTGTKHLVHRYVEEVAQGITWLAEVPLPPVQRAARLARFERGAHNYGRTCLMLSGGGTLGWIHLGVVKALFEHDLLPTVMSGASMGAMLAAGICSRTDPELRALFNDLSVLRTHGLERTGLGPALDPSVLLETIRHNCGDHTFAEARARSGRVLNISLSPVRRGQRPRLLCDLTAEDVLIAESALASSAIPGLFPPVTLAQRGPDGIRRPYLEGERWMDGSLHGDLPKRRMARLHQVNHFIVSQTNPHVVPFLADRRRRNAVRAAAGLTGKAVLRQGHALLSGLAQLSAGTPVERALVSARELAGQDYLGDIDLHPTFHPRLLARAFTNATHEELGAYVLVGERSAWTHLARIEVETRVARTFERCLKSLRAAEVAASA